MICPGSEKALVPSEHGYLTCQEQGCRFRIHRSQLLGSSAGAGCVPYRKTEEGTVVQHSVLS